MTAGSAAIYPRAATSASGRMGSTCWARVEPAAECMPVITGAPPEGRKELLGFRGGVRESAQRWRKLLVDIKARGLRVPPPDRGGRRGHISAVGSTRRPTS
ncbi:MAG: hypothetical protein Kow0058_10040 [Roseovarius sp.]